MKLTHDHLLQYRTPKGSWRKVQILALGLTWPPQRGWMKQVVGRELTDQEWQQFTGQHPHQDTLF